MAWFFKKEKHYLLIRSTRGWVTLNKLLKVH